MLSEENIKLKIDKIWPKKGPSSKEVEKYLKKYENEKIVVKCGGSILLDPNLFNLFIQDVIIIKKLGLTPIIVHGGGPRIKKKLNELNIESIFIKGLRVTNDKVIKVVEKVLIEFNKEIVDELNKKIVKLNQLQLKKTI